MVVVGRSNGQLCRPHCGRRHQGGRDGLLARESIGGGAARSIVVRRLDRYAYVVTERAEDVLLMKWLWLTAMNC